MSTAVEVTTTSDLASYVSLTKDIAPSRRDHIIGLIHQIRLNHIQVGRLMAANAVCLVNLRTSCFPRQLPWLSDRRFMLSRFTLRTNGGSRQSLASWQMTNASVGVVAALPGRWVTSAHGMSSRTIRSRFFAYWSRPFAARAATTRYVQ